MDAEIENVALRRQWMVAGAAGLAACAMPASAKEARRALIAGTDYPLVKRARFTCRGTYHLPPPTEGGLVAFDRTTFNDMAGDVTLLEGGMLRINTTGMYRVCLSLDWVAQNGTDTDLRLLGIRRKRVGAPPLPSKEDDRLASAQIPGADVPRVARYAGQWAAGLVAAGGRAFTEVALTAGSKVSPADYAMVSYTAILDDIVGADAADALSVRARVIGSDRARVVVENRGSQGMHVGAGKLNVMVMSASQSCGESADAWHMLHTTLEPLQAGELIYAYVRNHSLLGDYIQKSPATFIHIERWG